MQKIWKEAGYEDVECHRLLGDLLDKIKSTCAEELSAEQQILEHARAEAAAKITMLLEYSEKLGRDARDIVQKTSSMSLTDKLTELESHIERLSEEVSTRKDHLDTEFSAICKLVELLGESRPEEDDDMFRGPKGTPVLSDLRLQLMKQFKGDLERVREERLTEVKKRLEDSRQIVFDMMLHEEGFHTLELVTPPSDYQRQFDAKLAHYYNTGQLLIPLRTTDINFLKERLAKVAIEKEARRSQLALSGSEIARLWTLLRVPSSEREAFQVTIMCFYHRMRICREIQSLSIICATGIL